MLGASPFQKIGLGEKWHYYAYLLDQLGPLHSAMPPSAIPAVPTLVQHVTIRIYSAITTALQTAYQQMIPM